MRSLSEYQIERLFSKLLSQNFESAEVSRLWFARAKDSILLFLREDSELVKLLDKYIDDFKKADGTEEQQEKFARAKELVAVSRQYAALEQKNQEVDTYLLKEAEYALSKAARSSWLIRITAFMLTLSTIFMLVGTLQLRNFSLDVEERLENTLKARKQELSDKTTTGIDTLETLSSHGKTTLKKHATDRQQDLENVYINEKGTLKKHATDWQQDLENVYKDLENELTNLTEEKKVDILRAASERIDEISGDQAPDLLTVAKTVHKDLEQFRRRLNRARQRQTTIEESLSPLEGLSDRLDDKTLSQLKQLTFRERVLVWIERALVVLAFVFSVAAFMRSFMRRS